MHPIAIKLGALVVRFYGLMIAAGFLAGTWLATKEAKRKGISQAEVLDLVFYLLVGGIVGARVYYVLFADFAYYLHHPLMVAALWTGGLALHGGLITAAAVGVWFCRSRKLRFWRLADTLAPGIILGQALGRFGCAMNGCCYGKVTDLPWAITFRDPSAQAPLGVPLHPTQLYEMGGDLLILGVLWMRRKKVRFDGELFLTYAALYSVLRLVVEHFRGDRLVVGREMPVAQLVSVGVLVLVTVLWLHLSRRNRLAA